MRHIPNALSCLRILMIPFFVWQMMAGNTMNAGIILILSGLTDSLDGYLARRFNWISAVGKVLDPVADKLTQTAVSVVLIIKLRKYWYFFAVMILKDLVILACGAVLMKKGIKLEGAKWFGKVSTMAFYLVMILIVLIPAMPSWLIYVMLSATTGCALFSAVMYVPEYKRYKSLAGKKAEEVTAKAV